MVFAGGRILRPGAPALCRWIDALREFGDTHPRRIICIIALSMTVVGTYPLLFMGRSLVSPNNYGLPMLYEEAPFVPASTDLGTEDVRGGDVAATIWQEAPHSVVQREALADREMPLWNRYNASGRPLWGQGLTHFLDPLHWITLVTPDPALGWDLKFVAHRFLFALGIGLASLAITQAWLSSGVMAGAATFAGVFTYRLNHPAIFSLTYAPWVLLAWFQLAAAETARARLRAATLLAFASALLLVASTPKEAFVMLLGTHGVGALAVLLSPGSVRTRVLRFLFAAWAGAIFLLLTTPHWLIFFQTLKTSVTLYDQGYAHLAGLRHAVGLFLSPIIPGGVVPGLHLLGLVTTIAGVASLRRPLQRPAVVACAAGAVTMLAFAFGVIPPRWILRVPLVAQIGHLDDVLLTAVIPLLLIFGVIGVHSLLAASSRSVLVVTVVAGVAGLCLLVSVSGMVPSGAFELWALGLLLPIAIALPANVLWARRSPRSPVALSAVALSMLVLVLPGGLHARSGMEPIDRLLLQPRPRVPLDPDSPAVVAVHRGSAAPARTVGVNLVLFPGSQAFYALEGIGGADPLDMARNREILDAGGLTRVAYWITIVPPDFGQLSPLLDLLNVGFVLAPRRVTPPGLVEVPENDNDRLRAWRRPTAWPRAFFAEGIATYADAADLLKLVKQQGRPFAAIDPGDARAVNATRGLAAPTGVVVPATGYALTANSTRFHVRSPGAGVVVLGETFLPDDFRVTMNGAPVEYFRVNHVFKGIAIHGAGDWEIRFEYRPALWTEAWLADAAGWLLLMATWFVVERRYRTGSRSSEYPAALASS